jgi:hypothetical protein
MPVVVYWPFVALLKPGPNPKKVAKAEKALQKLEHILKESAHKLDDKAGGRSEQRQKLSNRCPLDCDSGIIV